MQPAVLQADPVTNASTPARSPRTAVHRTWPADLRHAVHARAQRKAGLGGRGDIHPRGINQLVARLARVKQHTFGNRSRGGWWRGRRGWRVWRWWWWRWWCRGRRPHNHQQRIVRRQTCRDASGGGRKRGLLPHVPNRAPASARTKAHHLHNGGCARGCARAYHAVQSATRDKYLPKIRGRKPLIKPSQPLQKKQQHRAHNETPIWSTRWGGWVRGSKHTYRG